MHIKQAFTVPPERQATTSVTSIARPVPRVPASLDGDALMERIRADGMELCVVIDEYGGTAGIVTTEDLIEEILCAVISGRSESDSLDRLVLAERLGVRTDADADALVEQVERGQVPSDEEQLMAAYYDFLTWLQESLTRALVGGAPE